MPRTRVALKAAASLLTLAAIAPANQAQYVSTTCMQLVNNPEQGPLDGDWFGMSVANLGDLDGVLGLELAVGAPRDHDAVPDTGSPLAPGAVFIQHLDKDGWPLGAVKITPNTIDPGVTDADQFGTSVAALGDVNGDGVGDLAVGAMGHPDGVLGSGAVYILFLDSAGAVTGSTKLSASSLAPLGITLGTLEAFGSSLACMGDLDGDGVPDLAVGAMGHRSSLAAVDEEEGAVYLLHLQGGAGNPNAGQPKSTWSLIDEVDLVAVNPADPDPLKDMYLFGSAVTPIGDIDGDGNTDLCVGVDYEGFVQDDPQTPQDEGVLGFGALYLLRLDAAGNVNASQKIASDNVGGFTELLDDHDVFGASLALLETGPNAASVAVGAWGDDDGGYGGALWILDLAYDPGSGSMGVSAQCKYSSTVGNLSCGYLVPAGWFGAGIASLGDVYPYPAGDGVVDLVVGEPHRTAVGAQSFRGATWVLPRAQPTPWKNLQHGLGGLFGEPYLEGVGTLGALSPVTLSLYSAAPNAPTFLMLGLSTANLTTMGGVLVPSPDLLFALTTDANGDLTVAGTWPSGTPSGLHIYFQCWIQDALGPAGYSASNAMSASAP